MTEPTASRRRGRALDDALLEAVWTELIECGYNNLTFEAVARRAGTSRTVLSRRWPTRADLVGAAVSRFIRENPLVTPETGNLREEFILLLEAFGKRTQPQLMRAVFEMGADLQAQGGGFGTLGSKGEPYSSVAEMLQRAVARDEVDPKRISPRAISLPTDLARHEIMIHQRPLTRAAIESILDDVVLPLVLKR